MIKCDLNSSFEDQFYDMLESKECTQDDIDNIIKSFGREKDFLPVEILNIIEGALDMQEVAPESIANREIEKYLSSLNLDKLDNIIKGVTVYNEVDTPSKTDEVDDLNKKSTDNLMLESFIRKAWNNTGASMSLYKRDLIHTIMKLKYFSEKGFKSDEDFEESLREYQQSLMDNIKDYLKNTTVYESIKDILAYEDSGKCNIQQFINLVNPHLSYIQYATSTLLKYPQGDKTAIAYANFVTLSNFDLAVKSVLRDQVTILNPGQYSDINPDNPKWIAEYGKKHSETWSDESKDLDIEVSEGIQGIIELFPKWNKNAPIDLSNMTFEDVKDIAVKLFDSVLLKNIRISEKELTSTDNEEWIEHLENEDIIHSIPSNSVLSVFEQIYGKDRLNTELIPKLRNKTLLDALVEVRDDFRLYPIVYFLLAEHHLQDLRQVLNSTQLNTLYGIYLNFFTVKEPKPGAEISLFLRALNSGTIVDGRFTGFNLNMVTDPYRALLKVLSSLEALHTLEYVGGDEGIEIKDTVDSSRDLRLSKFLQNITSKFSVNSTPIDYGNILVTPNFSEKSLVISFNRNGNRYTIERTPRTKTNKDNVKIFVNDSIISDNIIAEDFFDLFKIAYGIPFKESLWEKFKETLNATEDLQPIRRLVRVAAEILYNYEVAKDLKDIQTSNEYLDKLSNYYDLSKDSDNKLNEYAELSKFRGIDYLLVAPLQLKLADVSNVLQNLSLAKDIDEQITATSTNKDAANKNIMSATLSQCATKPAELWARGAKKKGAAGELFSIYDLYRGVGFNRNFSAFGTSKEATSFNESEFYLANLLYDYYGLLNSENANINVMAAVISDKSKLIKVAFALKQIIPKYNKPLIEFTNEELENWISDELGVYYRRMYDTIKNEFSILESLTDEVFNLHVVINPETDFEEFNDYCRFNGLKFDLVFHELIYAALSRGLLVNITENSYYTKTDNGIGVNPSLIHQLSLWNQLSKQEILKYKKIFEKKRPISLVFESKENFFKAKSLQLATQLILDRVIIETRDRFYGNRKNNKAIQQLIERNKGSKDSPGWITTSGNIAIFKFISGDFETKISTRRELIESYPYLRVLRLLNVVNDYPILNSQILDKTIFNIDSPNFDLEQFVENQSLIDKLYYQKQIIDEAINKKEDELYKTWIINSNLNEKFENQFKLENNWENRIIYYKSNEAKARYLSNKLAKQEISKLNIQDILSIYPDIKIELKESDLLSVIVNPELIKHNLLDFGLGEEYVDSTVGTFLNHPGPTTGSIRLIESAMYGQQTKRNVSYTATKHEFVRNLLNGIASERKIIVVREPKNSIHTINGSGSTKPMDGATYCNMLTNYAENASLGFDSVGVDKKQFIHFYKEHSGTGGIIKTAGFVVTNERINAGKLSETDFGLDYRMNKLMNDTYKWSDWLRSHNIQKKYHDWTKNYLRNNIDFGKWYIYKNGKYYVRSNPRINENGETIISEYEITKNGIETNKGGDIPVGIIDSNFQLWDKVFGGINSARFINDNFGNKILSTNGSNSSSELLFKAYSQNGYNKYKDGVITSSLDIELIMKDCAIDYIVTEGAIKQGAANINPLNILYEDNPKVTIMTIGSYDSGILLNAEHAADDSLLSLMTLVVNALAARGYSVSEALEVYNALLSLTMLNLQGIFEGIKTNLTEEEDIIFKDALSKIIYNSLLSLDVNSGNLLTAIADSIVDLNLGLIGYEQIKGKLPISNPVVFKKILSNIASSLTKSCIRIKFPGGMEVLNPSDGRFKLVNGRPMSYYTGKKLEQLKKDAEIAKNTPITFADIDLDSAYFIKDSDGNYYTYLDGQWIISSEEVSTVVSSPEMYRKLKKNIPNAIVYSDILTPKDLASYNVRFRDSNGRKFQLWDLQIIEDLDNAKTDEEKKIMLQELQRTLNALSSGAMNKVAVNVNGNVENVIVDKSTIEVSPYELILPKMYATAFGLTVDDDLASIKEDRLFFLKRALLNRKTKVNNSSNYDLELKTITGNHHYILFNHNSRQLPNNLLNNEVKLNWSWLDGKMVRVINGEISYDIPFTYDENGVAVPNLKIYKDSNGQEILYTLNIAFFLDNLNYNRLLISQNITENLEYQVSTFASDLLEEILKSLKKPVKQFLDLLIKSDEKYDPSTNITDESESKNSSIRINLLKKSSNINKLRQDLANNTLIYNDYLNNHSEDENFEQVIELMEYLLEREKLAIEDAKVPVNITWLLYRLNKINQSIETNDSLFEQRINNPERLEEFLNANPEYIYFYETGLELHVSFIKSLNFIASRTPAQSHLSFMPMRVVAFDNSGLNSAYVSRYQLYLQGSDYDIDKASLLGYKFRNGKLVIWSPFFDMRNEFNLKESEKLPFPTGKTIELAKADDILLRPYDVMDKTIYVEQDWALDPTTNNEIIRISDSINPDNFLLIRRKDNDYVIEPHYQNANVLTKYLFRNAISDLIPVNAHVTTIGKMNLASLGFEAHEGYWIKNRNFNKSKDFSYFNSAFIGTNNLHIALKVYNLLGRIPNTMLGRRLAKTLNLHNLYFSENGDIRGALVNFISTYMFNISSSPRNLILAQTGIDVAANRIKKYPEDPKYSKLAEKTKHFDRGSVLSKMRMVVLTLAGKADVGIMASSMKTFEAMSLYYYKILNTGDELSLNDLLIHRKLAGFLIDLIANSATNNILNIKNDTIKLALANVDNYEDAFILMSAFLSLATDNAKDPVLSKINANPEMIGLYTAGFVLGIPINTLLDIMMSDTAIMLANRLSTNVFNGGEAKVSLNSAILLLMTTPNIKSLSEKNLNFLNLINAIINPNTNISDIISNRKRCRRLIRIARNLARRILENINKDDISEGSSDLEDSLQLNVPFIIRKELERRKNNKLSNIFYDDVIYPLMRALRKKHSSELEQELERALEVLNNLKEHEHSGKSFDIPEEFQDRIHQEISNQDIQKLLSLKPSNKHLLLRFLDLTLDWLEDNELIYTETIIGGDGLKYNPISIIRELSKFSSEMGNLRDILKLNQGLPNSVEDQMTFLRKFENIIYGRLKDATEYYNSISKKDLLNPDEKILFDNYEKAQTLLEELSELNSKLYVNSSDKNYKVNLIEFISNPEYRNLIFEIYDNIKYATNIFRIMYEVSHYRGYLTTVTGLIKSGLSKSELYRDINFLTDEILIKKWKISKSEQILKFSKQIEKFILFKLNNDFLTSRQISIKVSNPALVFDNNGNIINEDDSKDYPIVLGTYAGNSSFKSWMETVVIPSVIELSGENAFLNALYQQPYTFNLNHKVSFNYFLSVNTIPKDIRELQEFDKVKLDFNRLYDIKFLGYKFGDLIYLYNIVAYGGSGGNTFTSLFEDKTRNRSSELINSYNLFYSFVDMDNSLNYLGILNLDETINEDLLEEVEKFIAPVVTYKDLNNERLPYRYVLVQDTSTKQYVLLLKKVKESESSNYGGIESEISNPIYEQYNEEVLEGYEEGVVEIEELNLDVPTVGLNKILSEKQCAYENILNRFFTYNREYQGVDNTDSNNKLLILNDGKHILLFNKNILEISPSDLNDTILIYNNESVNLKDYLQLNGTSVSEIIAFRSVINDDGSTITIIDPITTGNNLEAIC